DAPMGVVPVRPTGPARASARAGGRPRGHAGRSRVEGDPVLRQKLALAQAFMEGQQVLLLDEPFNALDRASVDRTHELLARFHAPGRTIVFTSHQESDIARLATRELVIDDGRVLAGQRRPCPCIDQPRTGQSPRCRRL
ncbi:MAG: hypothetical protein ACK5LN_00430, partial [Propioniciclava sp.]